MKKYPRFFIIATLKDLHDYPIWGRISYVILEGTKEKYKLVYKNNTVSEGYYGEASCDRAVSQGIWKEISIEEVALL